MGESLLPHSYGAAGLAGEELCVGPDVPDFPKLEFSNKDVKRAGEMLASDLVWTEESRDEIVRAFQIANNWRDAHAYPMRSVRQQLIGYVRNSDLQGITAARLKRMQAIRNKLKRIGLKPKSDSGFGRMPSNSRLNG